MLLSCEKRRLLPPRRLLLHLVLLTRVRRSACSEMHCKLFESHRQLQNQSVEGFERTLAVREQQQEGCNGTASETSRLNQARLIPYSSTGNGLRIAS